MAAWSIQEAEHSAREVFQRAFTGEPQIVVSDGVPSIVIISYADYESHASIPKIDSKARISAEKEPSLVEALLSCPCDISDLIEDCTGYDLPSAFDKEECFVAEGQA